MVRKIWSFGLQHLVPSPQTQLERVQVSCQEHLVLLPLIQLTNLPGTAAPDSKTTHILFHLQCEKKSPPCSSFYVTSMRLFSSLSFFSYLTRLPSLHPSPVRLKSTNPPLFPLMPFAPFHLLFPSLISPRPGPLQWGAANSERNVISEIYLTQLSYHINPHRN